MSDNHCMAPLQIPLNRRQCLSRMALLLAAAALPAPGLADPLPATPRVAALEWSVVEMLYALGLTPVAVSDISGYNNWVASPALPSQVTELGLRTEPNLELLASLSPDLLILPAHSPLSVSRLQQIAPVWQYPFFVTGKSLSEVARENVLQLAARLDRTVQARQFIQMQSQNMAACRQQLQPFTGKKVLMFTLISPRQALVLGTNSLFGEVLTGTGLQSAWQGATGVWGSVIVGVEQLLTCEADYALQFSHNDQPLMESLAHSPVWQQMPFNQHHRRWLIEPIWLYGGLYSAGRFADRLVQVAEEWHG